MIHPSKLGSWARCPKRAWHDLDHGEGLGAIDIATWVGTAAHAAALGMVPPAEPTGYILYDSTTPSLHVARQQAQWIARSVWAMLTARGLRIVERERAVEDDSISGTLDMLLLRDVGGREIGDLKTGKAIPTGAWLQLGAYWDAYNAEARRAEVETVSVFHVPRMPLGRDGKVHYEQRPGAACAAAARILVDQVEHWLYTKTLETVPATPGLICHGCPVTDCAVRATKEEA